MRPDRRRRWFHSRSSYPRWVLRAREIVSAPWLVDEGPADDWFYCPSVPGSTGEELWLEPQRGRCIDADQGEYRHGRTMGEAWQWSARATLRAKPSGDICDNGPSLVLTIEPSLHELGGRSPAALLTLTPSEVAILASFLLHWLIVGQWCGLRTLLWTLLDWSWPVER